MKSAKAAVAALVLVDLLAMLTAWMAGNAGGFKQAFFSLPVLIGIAALLEAVSHRSAWWKIVLVCIAGAGLIALCVPAAHAAQPQAPMAEWINGSSTNGANALLCSIIGDPGGTGLFGCKGTTTPLHQILKTFNAALFAFGALWVTWILFSAIFSSAAEGAFLGKKNHSQWGPLRVTMGAAMLVPAFGGFNLAQLIMVWATAVGSGIAGSVATSSLSLPILNVGAIYTAPQLTPAASYQGDISSQLRCAKAYNGRVARWKQDKVEDEDATSIIFGYTIENTANGIILHAGETAGSGGYSPDECGTLELAFPPTTSADPNIQRTVQAVRDATMNHITSLIESYWHIVQTYPAIGDQEAMFTQANMMFDRALFDAVATIIDTQNKSTETQQTGKTYIQKYSWIGLGYQTIRATSAAAETVNSGQTKITSKKPERVEIPMSRAEAESYIDSFRYKINQMLSNLVFSLAQSATEMIKGFTSQNPILALQGFGVKIVGWVGVLAMWVFVFPILASLLALGVSFIPYLGEKVAAVIASITASTNNFMLLILLTIGVPLAFFGLRLACYIPFLVAIMWTGAILAWLMVVLESLVGAPLWALAHLDLEGEGMGQRTVHGYLFLLNLLFRPILLVFSLAAAMLTMSAVFSLFGQGISGMVVQISAESDAWFTNLLMILGAVMVIVFTAESIITQSLSFLWNIPNQVFTWLGGQFGSNVGQGIDTGGQETRGAISSMAQKAENFTSRPRPPRDADDPLPYHQRSDLLGRRKSGGNAKSGSNTTNSDAPAISGEGSAGTRGGTTNTGETQGKTQPPKEE